MPLLISMSLKRFIQAQDDGQPSYSEALGELCAGSKRSHWIWYVLPQLRGLGSSPMAQRYGIDGLREAHAYLAHPVLGARLLQTLSIIEEQLQLPAQSLEKLMGSGIDAQKMVSCLTLFEAAGLVEAKAPLDLLQSQGWQRCAKTLLYLAVNPAR